MNHFWLLMYTWNREHAVFFGEQALTLSPKYWPTEAEANEHTNSKLSNDNATTLIPQISEVEAQIRKRPKTHSLIRE